MKINRIPWEVKAAAKRAATLAKIKPSWRLKPEDLEHASRQRNITGQFIERFLNAEDILVTGMDSVPIVNAIKDGKLSATKVTAAFCKRAAIAHQINNCLHEIFFDQALDRAKYLDEYFAKHRMPIGPLHGLPISLKDQFHVKGVDTSMGYIGWIGSNLGVADPSQIHQIESQIVTELQSLGAVPFCKTSLPQTLLFGETKNNIIGETLNPHNQNLSCGGSSGGEGSLQALRGSSVGVGSDIGGSVRIPASFCGICSIKPTTERLAYRDVANTNPGQTAYRSTIGFMATSIDALLLVFKSVLSTKPWVRDPNVVPLPFRQDMYDSFLARADGEGKAKPSVLPLKIGVLWTDGTVGPHPPVLRGLRMVADALRSCGHKIISWEPPPQHIAKQIHVSLLKADGARDIHNQLEASGEPLISDLEGKNELRPPMDLLDYQDLTLRGLAYEREYSDYWNSTADDDGQIVDAVIMPTAPHAAVVPGQFYHTAYTEAINLLNYAAVVIPVTKADQNLDEPDDSYAPLNAKDRMNWESYNPSIYDGAPVGVQIVARKFEEEKVLALSKIIMAALDGTSEEQHKSQV
ncbi:amidase signature domain-containing protein [Mariannaea sp. PMI_226]|nr:amidase signature domain-containing protein [Mariannaea sp. PMI_226]